MPAHSGGTTISPAGTLGGRKNGRADAEPATSRAVPRRRAQTKSFMEGLHFAGRGDSRARRAGGTSGDSRTPGSFPTRPALSSPSLRQIHEIPVCLPPVRAQPGRIQGVVDQKEGAHRTVLRGLGWLGRPSCRERAPTPSANTKKRRPLSGTALAVFRDYFG